MRAMSYKSRFHQILLKAFNLFKDPKIEQKKKKKHKIHSFSSKEPNTKNMT
ncbi:hypothetical protein Hanom_Chr00s000325g01637401 [Helianthus anomalus]